MRIGVVGSMHYTEKMVELRDKLNELGHDAFITTLHAPYINKTDEEKEAIKHYQKNNLDAIREFWRMMQGADAILVANYDRHGIKGYIGGNTFLEMGFAHVLDQDIYVMHELPDMPYCKAEMEAFKPVILHGDLALIPLRKA